MAPFGVLGPDEGDPPIVPVEATIILAGRLDERIVATSVAIIESRGGTIVSNADERSTGSATSRSKSEGPLGTC